MSQRDDMKKTPQDLNHYEPEDWFEGKPKHVEWGEYKEIRKWARESSFDIDMEQERENW